MQISYFFTSHDHVHHVRIQWNNLMTVRAVMVRGIGEKKKKRIQWNNHPLLLFSDPQMVETLPVEHFRKHVLIAEESVVNRGGGWARPLRLKVPLKVPLKGTLRSIEGLVSPPPPPPLRRSEALRVPLRYPLRYPLRSPLRYPLRSPLRYPLRYPLRSPLKVPLKGTLKVPLQGTLQGYP